MYEEPQILTIGAGPAGMATAACLAGRGISCDLVDRRGVTGGAYHRIHSPLTLASPTRYTALPGLAPLVTSEYLTAGEYREYLARYAAQHRLVARAASVCALSREGGAFRARFEDGAERAYRAVVVATGMADHPRFPDLPGLAGARHALDWPGAAALAGRRVLVIGCGVSGVELAEDCARSGVPVVISSRKGTVKPLPQRVLGRDIHDVAHLIEKLPPWLARRHCAERPSPPGIDRGFGEHLRAGRIRVRGPLARLDGTRAHFRDGASEDFDLVVTATGYDFATPFLPPEVTREPAGHPVAKHGESAAWPGLFFVGFPCASTLASEFLRGMAEDAPRVADRIAGSI